MPNVIDFLERMGQDAWLRHATASELQRALTEAGIEPALQAAIVSQDRRQLDTLLGANSQMCCLVRAPDQEDEPAGDEPDTPNDDDKDDEPAAGRPSPPRATRWS